MLAIIADSPSLARTQLADAVAFAREQGIPLEVIATSELDRPEYVRNDAQRCFFCKDELFTLMEDLRAGRGFDAIAYGVNLDDQGDFRPGQKAAANHHVVRSLLDAGLTKDEIRALARRAGLRIWDKPASACLSSRIEYGRPVTREALAVVEKGEDAMRALGFRQFRVRHHGDIVRIEIAREELARALDPAMAAQFTGIFKALGLQVRDSRSGRLPLRIDERLTARGGFASAHGLRTSSDKPSLRLIAADSGSLVPAPTGRCEIINLQLSMFRRFLVTLIRRSFLLLLIVCLGCVAQSVSPDLAQKIERQVRSYYKFRPSVKVQVGPASPSPDFPSYDSVVVTIDNGERKQDLTFPGFQRSFFDDAHDQIRSEQRSLRRDDEQDRRQRAAYARRESIQGCSGQF